MISPDGKLLYFFADDVLIYDTTEFKQVDKWELSRPLEEGLGPVRLRTARRHVRRARLLQRHLQRAGSGAEPPHHGRRAGESRREERRLLAARPGRGRSASRSRPIASAPTACSQDIGHYEFWTFDLEHHKLGSKMEFSGRPRMALRTSSNGKVLYIYQAGNTIDLYEAEHLQISAHDHARCGHDDGAVSSCRRQRQWRPTSQ